MSLVYRVTKIGTRLKYKLRHHRGHGIHSPFVFNFINDVIEEKNPYYAYADIANYWADLNILDEDEKKHRLIFRIINRFNPTDVMVLGEMSQFLTKYVQSVSNKIRIVNYDLNMAIENEKNYCVYLNAKIKNDIESHVIENLFNKINAQSFIIVDNIRTNRAAQAFWRRLIKDQKVRVSLDLYHIGVLFFDTKYYKQNYKLSF